MKNYLTAALLLLIVGLIFLFTKAEYGSSIKPEFDRTDTPLLIKLHIYENRAQLMRAVEETSRIRGQAVWYENPENPNECEIHVMRPRIVDGDVTLTWGHELIHCVYGNYHE